MDGQNGTSEWPVTASTVRPKLYKIVRFYRDNALLNGDVRATGLTLEEAKAHCNDPETSSSTATSAEAREHTERYGEWFDGWDAE